MTTRKVLHGFSVRIDDMKTAEVKVIATKYGRNYATMVDIKVTLNGHDALMEVVGSIENSSHPDYTHCFYPAGKVKAAGLGPSFGDLNDVRAAAVSAAGFRMGAAVAQIAAKKKQAASV